MSDKEQDPSSQGYTNALEDVNDKFQAILEATEPIPKMQKQIGKILKWEGDVKLIPAMFEEVGSLRKNIEILKKAMKLLGRYDDRLETIEKRLVVVEQRVQ